MHYRYEENMMRLTRTILSVIDKRRGAAMACLSMLLLVAPFDAHAGQSKPNEPVPMNKSYLLGIGAKPIRAKTLCKRDQITVLTGELKNKKMVSLCASPDISKEKGYLQYRYGRSRTSIELEYPKRKLPPKLCFKENWESGDLGGSHALSFWIGEYRYTVFLTVTRHYPALGGVVVDRDGKLISFGRFINKTVAIYDNVASPIDGMSFDYVGIKNSYTDLSFATVASMEAAGLRGIKAIHIGSNRAGGAQSHKAGCW